MLRPKQSSVAIYMGASLHLFLLARAGLLQRPGRGSHGLAASLEAAPDTPTDIPTNHAITWLPSQPGFVQIPQGGIYDKVIIGW